MKHWQIIQFFFIPLLLVFSGCGSLPDGITPANLVSILPQNGSLYVCIDSSDSRDLVQTILKKTPYASGDTEAIINSTNRIYASVGRNTDGRTEVSFVLVGGYPVMFINSALSWNKEWEEIRGKHNYWKNRENGISIAIPTGWLILLSQGDIVPMLESYANLGEADLSREIEKEMQTSSILILFPVGIDPATASQFALNLKKNFVEEVWIRGVRNSGKYDLTSVIQVSEEVEPEAFKRLFQFVMLAVIRKTDMENGIERLRDVEFSVEGRMVKMSRFSVTQDELASLSASLFGGVDK
ncbi:MAG: hypothetical protein EHM28_03930 [Spirochaetaceae bacterium]|nr:MAG: hypothetical protein EHM28_03930 [Spirochaetaceae bacterium]